MKKRVCPNCQVELPVGSASIRFDSENSVICVACGKPIIAATVGAESKVEPQNTASSTIQNRNYGPTWPQSGGYNVTPVTPVTPKKAITQNQTIGTDPPWHGAGYDHMRQGVAPRSLYAQGVALR